MRLKPVRFLRWVIGAAIIGFVVFAAVSRPAPFYLKFLYILLLGCLMVLYRIFKGPTPADRVVAIDIFGILIVGFCVILQIYTKRGWYLDIGIAWVLQSFVSTLALAKYLEGKGFEE